MNHNHTILDQMLLMFSRFEFKKAVKEIKTKNHSRDFRLYNHFISMFLGGLSGPDSL